jgi:hypothetical protein
MEKVLNLSGKIILESRVYVWLLTFLLRNLFILILIKVTH